jgi:hypothetical protein
MTAGARAFLILFVIASIGAAWLLRIDTKPVGAEGLGVIVTDHWTGRVYLCSPTSTAPRCHELYPQN